MEKDLALDTYALDKHKKYVKQLLEKVPTSSYKVIIFCNIHFG